MFWSLHIVSIELNIVHGDEPDVPEMSTEQHLLLLSVTEIIVVANGAIANLTSRAHGSVDIKTCDIHIYEPKNSPITPTKTANALLSKNMNMKFIAAVFQ